jgi:hypothetical protein
MAKERPDYTSTRQLVIIGLKEHFQAITSITLYLVNSFGSSPESWYYTSSTAGSIKLHYLAM